MSDDQELTFEITEAHVDLRIDKALGSLPEIGSRSRAEWLIGEGRVRLGGKPVKSSLKTKLGDFFSVLIPDAGNATELKATPMELDILHEDGDLIVLNKPAGLVMHPAAGHADDTLVNALIAHTKDLSFRFGEKRPGIVHRLDRDTSGVLVVAKNDDAHEKLSLQFRERTIHRIYRALVLGNLRADKGVFTSYLARHPTHRKKFASVKGVFTEKDPPPLGKWARTNYQVLQRVSPMLSYVQLKLDTGRTHQIRVHLSEAGAPIVADELYGALKKISGVPDISTREWLKSFPRFALHASELGFKHPTTGAQLSFKVGWPDDLRPLLESKGIKDL